MDLEGQVCQPFFGEAQALDKWLVEQDFTTANVTDFDRLVRTDPHRALAAGIRTPVEFRHITIAELAKAQEDAELYKWFAWWEGIVFARRRLADPQWSFARDHYAEEIGDGIRRAEESRVNLQRWGVTVTAARVGSFQLSQFFAAP